MPTIRYSRGPGTPAPGTSLSRAAAPDVVRSRRLRAWGGCRSDSISVLLVPGWREVRRIRHLNARVLGPRSSFAFRHVSDDAEVVNGLTLELRASSSRVFDPDVILPDRAAGEKSRRARLAGDVDLMHKRTYVGTRAQDDPRHFNGTV